MKFQNLSVKRLFGRVAMAVSYTHLAVYKRQHYGREGIKTLGAVCNPKAGYRALRQL